MKSKLRGLHRGAGPGDVGCLRELAPEIQVVARDVHRGNCLHLVALLKKRTDNPYEAYLIL